MDDNNIDFTLMAERIKDIHSIVTQTKTDVSDVKKRMTLLEQGYGVMSSRVDRLETAIEQIKTTIGLNQTKQ